MPTTTGNNCQGQARRSSQDKPLQEQLRTKNCWPIKKDLLGTAVRAVPNLYPTYSNCLDNVTQLPHFSSSLDVNQLLSHALVAFSRASSSPILKSSTSFVYERLEDTSFQCSLKCIKTLLIQPYGIPYV